MLVLLVLPQVYTSAQRILCCLTFCNISFTNTNQWPITVTVLTTIIIAYTILALPLTTNSMIDGDTVTKCVKRNTVAGGSATRSGCSRSTLTITTNSMIQSWRDRTVGGFLACSSGLSRARRSCCSAARFLLNLSLSRSNRSSSPNNAAGTRSS